MVGTDRSRVSAALWSHKDDDVQEVSAEADAEHHIVCVQYSSYFGELELDGRKAFAKNVRFGTTALIRAGEAPFAVHRGSWRVMHMYLPNRLLLSLADAEDLVARAGALELVAPQCDQDDVIQQISRSILTEMRADAPLSGLRVDALGQDLAIQLLRAHSNLAGTGALQPRKGGLSPQHLRRVQDRLEDSLAEDTGLAALAAVAGLSEHHLCRAFRQSTGEPPHRWLLLRRIERARDLLASTTLSVAEIAAAVGYDDPSYFARLFKRHAGATPSAYRQERGL